MLKLPLSLQIVAVLGSVMSTQANAETIFGNLQSLKATAGPSRPLDTAVSGSAETIGKYSLRPVKPPTMGADAGPQEPVPAFAPSTVLLQIDPSATPAEIDGYLQRKGLTVLEVYENFGQIKAQYEFGDALATGSGQDTRQSADKGYLSAVEAAGALKEEGIVTNAIPDSLLAPHQSALYGVMNLETPSNRMMSPQLSGEQQDWGIADVEADKLWQSPLSDAGLIIGVLDVGFAPHEDLTFFSAGAADPPAADHGNHVAGIICAEHNGVGVRGVLKRCFVASRVGSFFPVQGAAPDKAFYVQFSQILSTLNDFIPLVEGPRIFNISLGYNWRANFGINPDEPSAQDVRTSVQAQGEFLMSVYAAAMRNRKVIFSAAGNDSHGGPARSAKFASPFNWAAITMRERGFGRSGVVVEAHDSSGQRATFSNAGGHVSCPGVNILSAVAFDGSGQLARNGYGQLSGTSMASPYCAGAFGLLMLTHPTRTMDELVGCLETSPAMSTSGTAMARLTAASQACTF